ncbi:MAG: hypothetical protein DRN37_05505 [Thermoplasmata archaeon]|nr:MAG: hypothetical protein B1H13_06190 [Desulfobacteraceae bacterium 4484_190.3]RLF58069.1 MAG: hypothetical protein DRN37_05505 [Thermoplasmata archaeon]
MKREVGKAEITRIKIEGGIYVGKYLMIANAGPEDPNRATVPFMTAKALVEKGHEAIIWLYNNAVYLMKDGCHENVQAPGLPPLEDLMLFLTTVHKTPIYIGISCAFGRGMVDEHENILCDMVYGELAAPPKLADLIVEVDHVVGF